MRLPPFLSYFFSYLQEGIVLSLGSKHHSKINTIILVLCVFGVCESPSAIALVDTETSAVALRKIA